MAQTLPGDGFAEAKLDVRIVDESEIFGRIHRIGFPDPLGYGKNASRFSDPRRRIPENRYGVVYYGATFDICFVEALLRDARDGVSGDLWIAETELHDRLYSTIKVAQKLTLCDFTGDGPLRMGIPGNVARGSRQSLARKWGNAIYHHPEQVDGIYYASRLNGQTNIAVFDRSVTKLGRRSTRPLVEVARLGPVLRKFKIALL